MKKHFTFFVLFVFLFGLPFSSAEKEEQSEDIIKCRTEQEVKEAKAKGVTYLQVGRYFYVRIGSEYKGPFRRFETAKKLRTDFEEKVRQAGIDLDVFQAETPGAIFNPRLITFPFVDLVKEKGVFFQAPEGLVVEATHVMIHPEPLYFEDMSFGPIMLKKNRYFAVTGSITARKTIDFATKSLSLWVGAAVINEDGEVLWRQYGQVDDDFEFKCLKELDLTPKIPRFLLFFTVAKGTIPTALMTVQAAEPVDTSSFDYHILCSAMLEMAENWFPPFKQAVEEEYNQLLDQERETTKEKLDRLKQKID